ncbi:spore germination protein [Virgibacillus xinjiangensis]|uniref:Spore germination protein n=1 Tax=Virgibacillus xinjiangensis TaxID=393090 RepID=A0ABV7CRD5_9BACI
MQRQKRSSSGIFPTKPEKLKNILEQKFENNPDVSFTVYEVQKQKIAVFFITYQIKPEKVERSLLSKLLNKDKEWTNKDLLNEIPLHNGESVEKLDDILDGLIQGKVFIYIEDEDRCLSYPLVNVEARQIGTSETESVVVGPKSAFTETLTTNLNLIRWRVRSTDLVMEEIKFGSRAKTKGRLVYIKSLANQTDIDTMRQRLEDLDIDHVDDTNMLMQYVEDSSFTLFPQFYTTELPDRASYSLLRGRICVMLENSPSVIVAPTTFLSFYESPEDLYMRWNTGTFLRFIRVLSLAITLLLTPMYVAAVTFHYEMIPTELLVSIGESRAGVPFPPIFEALLLEFLIELLREAGARLPTKIGQTIGIVGGVVIGTAAVQAGITSDILIIFTALSALASFTAPSYLMGTASRVLRFPMIILAGSLGILGIMYGICLLIIHLLKIKSLGRPYLTPLYPFRMKDFNKVVFRLPPQFQGRRFASFQPKDKRRLDKRKSSAKKDIDK